MKITYILGLPESGKSTVGRPLAVLNGACYGETSSIAKERLAQIVAGGLMTVYNHSLGTIMVEAGRDITGLDSKRLTELAESAGLIGKHYWNNALDVCTAAARNQINGAIALERSGNRELQPMRRLLVTLCDALRRQHGTDVLSRTIIERAQKEGFGSCIVSGIRTVEELVASMRRAHEEGHEVRTVWIYRPGHTRSSGSDDNTTVGAHHAGSVLTCEETETEALGIAPTAEFPDPKARAEALYNAIWSGYEYCDKYYGLKQIINDPEETETADKP